MAERDYRGKKIPSAEWLIDDSQCIVTERRRQRKFRLAAALLVPLLPTFLFLRSDARDESPDRVSRPERTVPVHFQALPLQMPAGEAGRIVGAWRVTAADPRFGGVSALALTPDGMVAVSDSGVVSDLPRPGASRQARLRDLPAGPGAAGWKMFRDSEALVRTPEGWWVGFEFRHSVWLFDPTFRRPLRNIPLRQLGWPRNKGVEAMVAEGDGLLILPEGGRQVVHVAGGRMRVETLRGTGGHVADAARAPDGTVLMLLRSVGLGGITNRVARLVRGANGYCSQAILTLPLGRFDNAEALGVEPLASGASRLWIITDNDFSSWRDTLLIALDLPQRTLDQSASC